MPNAGRRLLVLSYHSWETPAETLRRDIADLRALGWRPISRADLLSGSITSNAFLVTTDDGHSEDEGFFAVLLKAECPGITFINVGRLPPGRVAWYRERARGDAVAVEDHGQWHRRHFVSSCVTGWAGAEPPREDIAHLGLVAGHPLCALGGELSAPRFHPDPAIADVARFIAASSDPELIGGPQWAQRLERELVMRQLATRRLGRLCLRGHFERWDAFEARARDAVLEGRRAFEQQIGAAPRLYAYTWWQGSLRVDRVLERAGYAGSFWGRDRMQPVNASRFGIPRVEMSPRTPRPLRPDAYPDRTALSRHSFDRARAFAKQLAGVR